jgi:hypothetical protein
MDQCRITARYYEKIEHLFPSLNMRVHWRRNIGNEPVRGVDKRDKACKMEK